MIKFRISLNKSFDPKKIMNNPMIMLVIIHYISSLKPLDSFALSFLNTKNTSKNVATFLHSSKIANSYV